MTKKASILLLVPAIALLCTACSSKQTEKQQPLTVTTARVAEAPAEIRKEFPFIAKPFRSTELSFRVSGPIDRFEVYPGNFYKRGSIIAEIDPRDFRIRHQRAEAQYRQAKAEFERIESLHQKNNISASAYEKARAEYVSAKSAFDTATNELSDTRLIAPFDGYVGEVFIEKFQDVKATQPIITFVDIEKLKIEIYVTQDIVMQESGLKHASLSFDAQPNKVYGAQVAEYSRSTTPNNLSYLLTVLFPNPGGKLPAGISGKVFFDMPDARPDAVCIPQSALCHQPQMGDYVWIVDPTTNQVSRRSIISGGLLPNGMFAVTSGLKPGETVATSSLRFLSDSMQVEIDRRPRVQPINSKL